MREHIEITITSAKVLQIMPLTGWWINADRCPGAALVELEGHYGNGESFSGREILPLSEDLTIRFPKGVDWEALYTTHVLGDYHDYITFRGIEALTNEYGYDALVDREA